MIAIILASGEGSRLQPLTEDRPKPLVEVNGKAILEFQLDGLRENGIDRCVLTTGPFAEQLRSFAIDYSGIEFKFVHNERYQETDYIYTLSLVGKFLDEHGIDDDIILLHGDLVFRPQVIESLLVATSGNSVLVEGDRPVDRKDFCARVEDGVVQMIDTHLDGDVYQLYPVYRFERDAFDRWLEEIEKHINDGDVEQYAERALNTLLDTIDLSAVEVESYCREVDTRADLAEVTDKLRR